MNVFDDFEIECIKLIISNNYNIELLKRNKFINNYSKNKKLFKKYLDILKINYKNIVEYHNNINNLSPTFTGIELKNLIKIDNCLGYFNN